MKAIKIAFLLLVMIGASTDSFAQRSRGGDNRVAVSKNAPARTSIKGTRATTRNKSDRVVTRTNTRTAAARNAPGRTTTTRTTTRSNPGRATGLRMAQTRVVTTRNGARNRTSVVYRTPEKRLAPSFIYSDF